jgi:hypothetical protein
VPEVGLERDSKPWEHWEVAETCGLRTRPESVRASLWTKMWTVPTPSFSDQTLVLARDHLGEGQEKLLQLFLVHCCVLLNDALLQARSNDGKPGPVECFGDSRKLGDNILAVPAFLQHAGNSHELALGTLEPVDHWGQFGGVEFQSSLQKVDFQLHNYTP